MKPTTLLLVAAAAVGGYLVYTRIARASAPTPPPTGLESVSKIAASVRELFGSPASAPTTTVSAMTTDYQDALRA